MTIQTRPAERKEMAHAIAGFLGICAEYMRAPTYRFRIGCVTVNRDGTTDCEDPEVLERLIPMLIENNYLTEAPTPEDTPATEPERIQEPDPATAPAQETPAQTAEPDSHEDPEPLVAPEAPDPAAKPDDEQAPGIQEPDGEIDRVNIHIQIEELTPGLMRNIVYMLYSKQHIINKALGNSLLRIEDDVIARLQEYATDSTEELNTVLQDFEALGSLEGIAFTSDNFSMSFPPCDPGTHDLILYAQLLAKVVDACKSAGRTRPKLQQTGDNEKYLMHSWLIRLGCGGPEFKELRRRMTGSLNGYCAFPDQNRADRHKAKYEAQVGYKPNIEERMKKVDYRYSVTLTRSDNAVFTELVDDVAEFSRKKRRR